MAKESLVIHVRKLLLKKYMKNHKIFFFFNKVEEKKIREEDLISRFFFFFFFLNTGVCMAFIMFMINLANLKINYQRLNLSLN